MPSSRDRILSLSFLQWHRSLLVYSPLSSTRVPSSLLVLIHPGHRETSWDQKFDLLYLSVTSENSSSPCIRLTIVLVRLTAQRLSTNLRSLLCPRGQSFVYVSVSTILVPLFHLPPLGTNSKRTQQFRPGRLCDSPSLHSTLSFSCPKTTLVAFPTPTVVDSSWPYPFDTDLV